MRTSACKAVRSVSFTSTRPRCRIVANRRLPQQRRAFQSTPRHLRQDDPPEVPDAARHSTPDEKSSQSVTIGNSQEAEDGVNNSSDGTPRSGKPVDRNNYGSASKRAGRNIKKPKEVPPVYLPQRFLDYNVVLREKLVATQPSGQETFFIDAQETPLGREIRGGSSKTAGPNYLNVRSRATAEERDGSPGSIDVHVMQEIYSLVVAGLRPTSMQYPDPNLSAKPHVVLHCPRNGGMFFLDAMVKHLAGLNSADVIQIEAQDIAEIGGNYLDGSEVDSDHLSSLGYDVYMPGARESRTPGETPEEDEYSEEMEEEDDDESNRRPKVLSIRSGVSVIPLSNIGNIANNLAEMVKTSFGPHSTPQNPSSMVKVLGMPAKESIKELKVTALIETLLHAADAKRAIQSTDLPNIEARGPVNGSAEEEVNGSQPGPESSKLPNADHEPALILQIKDYLEMNNTSNGNKLLDALHEAVKQRRKEGQKILIVGTSAYESTKPQSTKSGFKNSQSDLDTGPLRTVMTPVTETMKMSSFKHHHRKRLVAINGRNLQDMIRRLGPDSAQIEKFTSLIELNLDSAIVFVSDMTDRVLPSERVHRIATVALGLLEPNEEFSTKHLERAIHIIESSDNAKYDWFETQEKKVRHQPSSERMRKMHERNRTTKHKKDDEDRLQKLRKTCNSYERKLLNGVIDPGSIRTTFADVRVLPETIDTLKTLTSLSLVRPDAFTYGVLATDRIPGLLLYGPPGTGKTLLAKAVAKESGATVLEVSGSDIYDKYVGEGEKNVKAVFSLAKKLTPCIVFIDEADAILGSRGGSANRSSHRELINQFLREWDGMSETSAFIMVATNRPFDLDEASLRRLPRRMLVDLPTEKDREAILGIHLKDEHLDPDISLAKLASDTPFYSGSDLKNLAVAAALACVREEYETAMSLQSQTESSPSTTPAAEAQPSVIDPPPSSSESNSDVASSSETASTTSNAAHDISSETTNSSSTPQPEEEPATAPPKTSPPPPYPKYPRRRTLRPHHFTKALQEISASISDDMRSLTAIRKFDEKYGDRRGRRKKLGGGYGFATVGEEERERVEGEGARIRKER